MKKVSALISGLIIIVIGSILALVMQTAARKLPVRQYFPASKTVAIWDWHSPVNRSDEDLNQLGQFFYLHQINTVYVDIGSYADFNKNNDTNKKIELENSLIRYIKESSKHGVKVYAAAGNTDWSKPELRSMPLSIQDFVINFNKNHPTTRLSGLEFDIEAYNQKGFPDSSMTEKTIVLSELLDTVKLLAVNQEKDKSIDLGFAIPYWFDNENGNIPSITWDNKTGPTLYHLVDTINKLDKSNIVVMAYRNAANGNDGTIFHSRTEVEYASTKAPNVKVLIGQEVNDVQPSKITYYSKPISELSSEVTIINEVFKNSSSYGGIAINDLNGLQQMDKTDPNAVF